MWALLLSSVVAGVVIVATVFFYSSCNCHLVLSLLYRLLSFKSCDGRFGSLWSQWEWGLSGSGRTRAAQKNKLQIVSFIHFPLFYHHRWCCCCRVGRQRKQMGTQSMLKYLCCHNQSSEIKRCFAWTRIKRSCKVENHTIFFAINSNWSGAYEKKRKKDARFLTKNYWTKLKFWKKLVLGNLKTLWENTLKSGIFENFNMD